MAVLVELYNTGDLATGTEVQALVEHVLSDRPGEWRVREMSLLPILTSRWRDPWIRH
jgi:hypothetical protein